MCTNQLLLNTFIFMQIYLYKYTHKSASLELEPLRKFNFITANLGRFFAKFFDGFFMEMKIERFLLFGD